jgi:hypothetical protein
MARIQSILSQIRKIQIAPPPPLDRQASGSGRYSRLLETFRNRRQIWERTPLIIKTSIEGLAIGVSALALVASVPQIKKLYEKSVQSKLGAITEESLSDLESEALTPDANEIDPTDIANAPEADEGDSDEAPAPEWVEGEDLKVGSSEIWRFYIKTDSPKEIRARVTQILKDIRVTQDAETLAGLEAPGGIQFDLILNKTLVGILKANLQKLSRHRENDSSQLSQPFTWYKSRSKKPVPPGKARVVIWLSQT